MAFLRVEKKKSGTYLRIVESYKASGKSKHRTLHSLGKVEDYPSQQLENIAKKLLELAGICMEDIVGASFREIERVNYGYALVIKRLWKLFDMTTFCNKVGMVNKTQFDWLNVLQLMIAERLNEPSSKRQSYFNQEEYFGFGQEADLHHFYRTLNILSQNQDLLKQHLFSRQRSLFSQKLDVVFYDVTTLYFDSQVEKDGNKRRKGYCKDGKAHKTQVVLGLLVDKFRNPVTYQIYEGNTYEGHTMVDALKTMQKDFNIDNVIAVADSAMIDTNNREFMVENNIDYILGDRLKSLPRSIQQELIDTSSHLAVNKEVDKENFSYKVIEYKGRKIICTYSAKRARKDAFEREKLINKAKVWLENPGKYKQVKKRGAGRFVTTDDDGLPIKLDLEKIEKDSKFDGFKAIATTTDLPVEQILSKYNDLFEVEHAFRTLKSQLEIRPMFHWNNERIEGHIAMCFIAYTFLNYLRNTTGLQYRQIVKSLDRMQMSVVEDDTSDELLYMRSKITENDQILVKKLKLVMPKDVTPQSIINQIIEN